MKINSEPLTQDEFDLLAEGEFDLEERSQLIQRIEETPGGWKQCALAFLETQSLSRTVRGVVQFAHLKNREPNSLSPNLVFGKKPTRPGMSAVWVAAALTLMACSFGIGTMLDFESVSNRVDPGNSEIQASNLVNANHMINEQTLREMTLCVNAIDLPDSVVLAVARLRIKDGTQLVPIIRSVQLERELANLPTPKLPDNFDRDLRQTGWVANLSRQILSINAPSGQRELMPIDSIGYQYVGRKTF